MPRKPNKDKWISVRFKQAFCYNRSGVVYTSVNGERKNTNLKWIPENKEIALRLLDKRVERQIYQDTFYINDAVKKFWEVKKRDMSPVVIRKHQLAIDRLLTKNLMLSTHPEERRKMRSMLRNNILKLKHYSQPYQAKQIQKIKKIFEIAKDYDLITYQPILPDMMPKNPKKYKKIKSFSEKEIELIFDNVSGELKRACQIFAVTGARRIEVMRIESTDIKPNYWLIRGKKNSNGELQYRKFPLEPFPELKKILYPFENFKKIQDKFTYQLKKLDIYEKGVGFHAFRRYAVNNMVDKLGSNNVNVKKLAEIFGHSIEVMEKVYFRNTDVDKLNNWLKNEL